MLQNMIRRRIELGLSQKDLASLCGVSRNTISNIERGIYEPSVYLAIRICGFLMLNYRFIDWLFERSES